MRSLKLLFSNLRYFAPAWVFASLNIVIGTWVLYIPYIKLKLGLDDGQLGMVLFFLALGTLTMIPLSSKIIEKLGVGRSTIIGIILFSLLFLLPLVMPSYVSMCISLFIVGMGVSLTDISMNALVSQIEMEDDVHFMSVSHGFFSLGGVIGAGIGTVVITYFSVPIVHMLFVAFGVIITNLLICKAYYKERGRKSDREANTFRMSLLRPLVGLTVISFIIMGSEGAIEHWSKLYLQDIVIVNSERIAGLGFVTFSAMMTLGRFFGDSISHRYGPLVIIIGGCLISIIGYFAVLSTELTLSLVGFGLIGLGYSVIIPELFRLAGKTKGISSAEGISFVAGFGYLGFLMSPPLLGFLSSLESLKLSFTALLITTIIVGFIAGGLKIRSLRNVKS